VPVRNERQRSMRYDLNVARFLTKAAAAVLAFAISFVPTLLDQCAETCAAHPTAVASTPACHHAGPVGMRIGHVPPRCSHDHGGAAIAAIKHVPSKPALLDLIIAADSVPMLCASDIRDRRHPDQSPPGSSLALNAQSLPLRI